MGKTSARRRTSRPDVARVSGAGLADCPARGLMAAALMLLAMGIWSYWPIITGLVHTLRTSDDYSAGQFVPFIAIFLVWRDRKTLKMLALRPCWFGGVAWVLLAEMLRIYGFLSMRQSLERYALVLAVAGLVLLAAGRQVCRRLVWVLLFLFLMVPLPTLIHSRISPPLQRMAATGSVFLLEVIGVCVTQQGNIVNLDGHIPIAVAEACSGLRMLTAFVIVAAFVAYMVKRPRWLKGILLLSSIPIAVICNMARIFLTATMMLYINEEIGKRFFHDFAGLVMMPIAVSLLFGEIWLLDRIVESDEPKAWRQMVVRTGSAQRTAPRRRLTGVIGHPEHAADAYSRK